MNDELDEAMQRLQSGERKAFDTVFDLAWPRVLSYSRRALGDGPDAEDAAQRALEKVFLRAWQFDGKRKALSWILAIATWEIRTLRTHQRRSNERQPSALPELPSRERSPEEEAVMSDLMTAAKEALHNLADSDRELVLDAIHGRQSQAAGVTPAALRKRRHRALDRLRAAWRLLYEG